MACGINSAGDRCAPLAILEIGEVDRDLRSRKSKVLQHKIPTARRRALWENVQQTRLKGLSLRAMARELGVHRNTIRKYALAESPSLRKKKSEASTQQPETGHPLTGHFRWTSTQDQFHTTVLIKPKRPALRMGVKMPREFVAKPWQTLLSLDSPQQWGDWVRAQGAMRNDDTTLIPIQVE